MMLAACALAMTLEVAPVNPPADVVRAFYDQVVKHHPLGIPEGKAQAALWPLLSTRARRRLEVGAACEDDYFRQHRRLPDAEDLKPGFAWLEQGLFSGWNEMALPAEVAIDGAEALGAGRFRVRLRFTYRDRFQTYGRPADDANTFSWSGAVLVVTEERRSVIDDFLLEDPHGRPLPPPLAFPGCQGPRWVGVGKDGGGRGRE